MLVVATSPTAAAKAAPSARSGGEAPQPATGRTTLAPVAAIRRRAATLVSSRPDAPFVTQLIASAEHMAQTRVLRRATEADAQAAYLALAQRQPSGLAAAGTRVSRRV